jgi:hypothetical protein
MLADGVDPDVDGFCDAVAPDVDGFCDGVDPDVDGFCDAVAPADVPTEALKELNIPTPSGATFPGCCSLLTSFGSVKTKVRATEGFLRRSWILGDDSCDVWPLNEAPEFRRDLGGENMDCKNGDKGLSACGFAGDFVDCPGCGEFGPDLTGGFVDCADDFVLTGDFADCTGT